MYHLESDSLSRRNGRLLSFRTHIHSSGGFFHPMQSITLLSEADFCDKARFLYNLEKPDVSGREGRQALLS